LARSPHPGEDLTGEEVRADDVGGLFLPDQVDELAGVEPVERAHGPAFETVDPLLVPSVVQIAPVPGEGADHREV